jgi:hypothetical protein
MSADLDNGSRGEKPMKEWRVTYEVRIGADTWRRDETGPYSQKNNAWREFTKRRDMPDVYRNVAIQERTVTYGDWLDYAVVAPEQIAFNFRVRTFPKDGTA